MQALALIMDTKPRQTIIRMDESLYRRLKAAAKRADKSVNSFMVSALEKSVEPDFPKLKLEDYNKPDPEWEELFKPLSGAFPDDMDWKKVKTEYLINKYYKK